MSNINLLKDLASNVSEEVFEILAESQYVKIERIVSSGHATPPGEWYDQERAEWVVVLTGTAVIEYDDGHSVELQPGSHVLIPAHKKHRVARTDQPTIWLAVHFS